MSTSKSSPPWKGLIQKDLSKSIESNKDSITYALSTADSEGKPRVRFVVHRGFVNEDRHSLDQGSESLCMVVTTDVRAPKALQIVTAADGAKVELAWWLEPVGRQYRIQGRAFLLPPPDHHWQKQFPAKQLEPAGLAVNKFDWEQERLRIYRGMSPVLRASFLRPIPGEPLKASDRGDNGEDHDPATWVESLPSDQETHDKDVLAQIQKALRNFALIVIQPNRVDCVDLRKSPNERTLWTQDKDEWIEVGLVP